MADKPGCHENKKGSQKKLRYKLPVFAQENEDFFFKEALN